MALTARAEAFCQAIVVKGMNQTEAYSFAYDVSKMSQETITNLASRLANRDDVRARLQVLRERATAAAVKSAAYTIEDALREADELMADGKALGQVSAAVAALKVKAQLGGHLAEKTAEKKGPLDGEDIDGLVSIREEINRRLQQAADTLDFIGVEPTSHPVTLKRVA